jgi:hypothetical protein
VSTRTGSSSLPALACAFSDSASSSFMKSCLMLARRFSHHSLSCSVRASISSRRSRRSLLAAISLADWKMTWPHPGTSALAWFWSLLTGVQVGSGGEVGDVKKLHTSITTSRSSSSISFSAR